MAEPTGTAPLWRFAAPVVLALCGVLLVTSAKESGGDDLRGSDTLRLSDLVRDEERRTQELEERLNELTAYIDELSAEHADSATQDLQAQTQELLPAAGFTAVEGPGLTATLDDAEIPAQIPPTLNANDYLVHQEDVDAVINALWAGGAEAMTVMGHRVVGTSSIKCVGPVIRVDGRVYAPPYSISAVGDVDAMTEALADSPGVRNYLSWADKLNLGWDLDASDEIYAPAYEGVPGGTS